jgi:hypothetical protein
MYAKKRAIADSPYEEVLEELHGAVPGLHAIAHRAGARARGGDLYHPVVPLLPQR